jgi:hypothetical protein
MFVLNFFLIKNKNKYLRKKNKWNELKLKQTIIII